MPTGDGLVVVDKPGGLTSHDVVARVRRLAGTRKVGHAGTLDPMATGVLVLGVNRATRLLGHLALTEKAYEATVRLGAATLTDDAEGEVVSTTPADGASDADVAAGLARLTGEIEQVPSSVSAVKVGGQRSYERVRAGEDVDLPARTVTVRELAVLATRRTPGVVDVDVRVVCSSGTYVRALARDLGAGLGVGGHLTALRRTRVGPYDLSAARTLDELAEAVTLLPIAAAARAAFPSRDVDAELARVLSHGGPIPAGATGGPDGPVAVFGPDGTFLALVEERGAVAKAVAVFV
jgi:tRNA pseudouridine55 synthase